MSRPERRQHHSHAIPSDRKLAASIRRGDTSALGQLYDRYAAAIYTLVCGSRPASAEHIVEQVFVELWNAGRRSHLPMPVAPMLLDLVVHALPESTMAPIQPSTTCAAPDAISHLVLIGRSDPLVCAVLVLMCVGKAGIAATATALDEEPAVVRRALSSGLILLRQLQPIVHADNVQETQTTSPDPHSGIQSSADIGLQPSVQAAQ
jgi:hypothetical protein